MTKEGARGDCSQLVACLCRLALQLIQPAEFIDRRTSARHQELSRRPMVILTSALPRETLPQQLWHLTLNAIDPVVDGGLSRRTDASDPVGCAHRSRSLPG